VIAVVSVSVVANVAVAAHGNVAANVAVFVIDHVAAVAPPERSLA